MYLQCRSYVLSLHPHKVKVQSVKKDSLLYTIYQVLYTQLLSVKKGFFPKSAIFQLSTETFLRLQRIYQVNKLSY